MFKNVYKSSRKESVILVRLWWNLNILDRFSKNPQMSKFMKILHVGEELFHGDGRTDTDMTKLVIGIRNSAKAPKKELSESTFISTSWWM